MMEDGEMEMELDKKATRRNRQLHDLLGDLPAMRGPVEARVLSSTENEGKPLPVILFNHSHGGIYEVGKDELLRDIGYLQLPNYAEFLTSLGYAV